MGNHDDVYVDADLTQHLALHLPGTEVVDSILLTRPGATDRNGIDGVDAVVTHGHLTDAWNGPGFALLGRAITWFATGLDDLPRLGDTVDGLPDEEATGRLLDGRGRNRLITLDPRFGGNRRFDSLDEQRLFEALAAAPPGGGWPWLVFGHTHFPMLTPQDAAGMPVRYANSGCARAGPGVHRIGMGSRGRGPAHAGPVAGRRGRPRADRDGGGRPPAGHGLNTSLR